MSLEVEKQKVEYKKKKVAASRKPLEPITNSKPSPSHPTPSRPTQVDSPQPSKNKGAATTRIKHISARKPSHSETHFDLTTV